MESVLARMLPGVYRTQFARTISAPVNQGTRLATAFVYKSVSISNRLFPDP